MANPQGHSHFVQLRSMVMQAWKQLVASGIWGLGQKRQRRKGQELILERLHQPEPEIQETLLALLEVPSSRSLRENGR
jgi:hypothetical protein